MSERDPKTLQTETPEGEQTLIPCVSPITARHRLALLMDALMRPRAAQKPLDVASLIKPRATSSTCSDEESLHDPDHRRPARPASRQRRCR
ncbi:hypothetical protein [Mesorhizobium sp. M1348]|uniref:hypothetical protein n=1 Tax=Mesorhizobium sp. M1348 TaxID=2957089 RepID=UPI00333D2ACA